METNNKFAFKIIKWQYFEEKNEKVIVKMRRWT